MYDVLFAIWKIGVRGFEPPTSRSRTERATSLRHTPFRVPHAPILSQNFQT
jgi:hypothetical protein